jgi:hypothetical protein
LVPSHATLAAFLVFGFALEETLCVLISVHLGSSLSLTNLSSRDLRLALRGAKQDLSPLQRVRLNDRRVALAKRLHAYRALQVIHMPGLSRTESETGHAGLPEEYPLLLPSALSAYRCSHAGSYELLRSEYRLREAGAHEALAETRTHLQTRTVLFQHQIAQGGGIRENMRTKAAATVVQGRINAAAARYTRCRNALLIIQPQLRAADSPLPGWEKVIRPLEKKDLTGINSSEATRLDADAGQRARRLALMKDVPTSTTLAAHPDRALQDPDFPPDDGDFDVFEGRLDPGLDVHDFSADNDGDEADKLAPVIVFEGPISHGQKKRREISWIWFTGAVAEDQDDPRQAAGQSCAHDKLAAHSSELQR